MAQAVKRCPRIAEHKSQPSSLRIHGLPSGPSYTPRFAAAATWS
jgi:hypothetical protein